MQDPDPRLWPFANAINCGVARKVSRKEWMKETEAVAAMDKEWNKLANHKRPNPKDKGIGAWEISSAGKA